MKTQGVEARFFQNLAPVSREKPQNPYLAYISHLFSKPYLMGLRHFRAAKKAQTITGQRVNLDL
ncbi:hypothetical protein H6F92_21380 [Microcystis wesenbergii FACHB-1317]|uniref:hypothetical protein n=1 Tax=Microcystis wesenbergii TaxID=44823 RepID=UPI00168118F9|nr:hypothetical protein [Microcystis wesenbergii]MBD2291184.1 hypothetical protein [Microcystis wesenbergii FACHB-1317]